MVKSKLLSAILIFISGACLTGQTDTNNIRISLAYPVHSQYLQNGLVINPAYAGSREALSFFVSARKQWLGIKGAPDYETFSMHSLLKNEHIGLGLTTQFLHYGFTSATSVYADYAYHLILGESRLSMGLRAGFDMSNTNYSSLILLSPLTDNAFINNNPYFLPNIGAGIYFYNKKFFFGAAIPSFFSYVKTSNGKISFNTFQKFDMTATAGALIKFTDAFKFKPSVFIDYSLDKTNRMRIDLNGNFIISDFIWIGGSWRTAENVAVGILQLQVNQQFMFGYSYDYPVGNLSNYSLGSHEVVLRYEFGYKVTAANPRYF